MAVTIRRIPSTDPRLGRHVRHDDRSRAYRFPTEGLTLRSVRHARRIPVLDQGQLGSCTGNAGIGCLGTDPFYATVHPLNTPAWANRVEAPIVATPGALAAGTEVLYALNEDGAVALYSAATKLDDAPGQYPPDDTGSDGLSVAKALKAAGEISGYQHTFSLDDALKAVTVTPVLTGVTWYNSMFDPQPDGRLVVDFASGLAGGHEFVVDEIDVENQRVWFTNSWGASWGVDGRAWLSWDDWGALLKDQGDVTVFVPLTQPAPTPTPSPTPVPPVDVDQALADALRHRDWVDRHHIGDNERVAHAGKAWLAAHGL